MRKAALVRPLAILLSFDFTFPSDPLGICVNLRDLHLRELGRVFGVVPAPFSSCFMISLWDNFAQLPRA
jgi:hypothetical protein